MFLIVSPFFQIVPFCNLSPINLSCLITAEMTRTHFCCYEVHLYVRLWVCLWARKLDYLMNLSCFLKGSVGCNMQLTRACGVPVGRLATTLVATIFLILFIFFFYPVFLSSVATFSHKKECSDQKTFIHSFMFIYTRKLAIQIMCINKHEF